MIDASIQAVLRSSYTIRKFFVVFGSVLVALLILLAVSAAGLPDGWLRDSATSFLGNFAASAGIFLVTYAFFVMVTPPGLRNAEVIPLRDVEISTEIIDLPRNASDYWFWGRSGAFFRNEVLPRLDKLASDERKHIHIRVVIPDPSIRQNSIRYMRLLTSLGDKGSDEETLAAHVTATVALIASTVSRNPYLKADVALCPTVPVLRFDLSTAGALLTRDAKHLPAILVNSGNPYFEMLKDAVENELNQSLSLSWDATSIGTKTAQELVQDMSLIAGFPKSSSTAIQKSAELLNKTEHRYG